MTSFFILPINVNNIIFVPLNPARRFHCVASPTSVLLNLDPLLCENFMEALTLSLSQILTHHASLTSNDP